MTIFWDRQNRPIDDTIEWAQKYEDPAYRIVAVDQDVPGGPMVSTIWEGLAKGAPLHPTTESALIFETAWVVNGNVEQTWWDHTEEQALRRHRVVCLSMLGREPKPEDGHVQTIVERDKK